MFHHRFYLPAFIALCILYMAVPASMIWKQESVLRQGALYRFRLQPVDPADAFRGRYLDLNFSLPVFPESDSTLEAGRKMFIALGKDSAGYAIFESMHREPPQGRDYIAMPLGYVFNGQAFIHDIPGEMRRYYLNEKIAPLADKWYLELLSRTEREEADVSLDLRVHKGRALIEQVYFEGIPVEEYIRRKESE